MQFPIPQRGVQIKGTAGFTNRLLFPFDGGCHPRFAVFLARKFPGNPANAISDTL